MPSVISFRLPAILLLMLLPLASGCGDATPQAAFNPTTGSHASGWGMAHKAAARDDVPVVPVAMVQTFQAA